MSWGTCQSLPSGARLFVLAPPVPRLQLPSLCCSESEDSIDGELNSENSVQLRLCFLFSATRTSHRESTYCTLSFNCVQVQTLPTAQATPALTDSFSRGYDPYTHACKARPLTTVGWTSLSVIVFVIVIVVPMSTTGERSLREQCVSCNDDGDGHVRKTCHEESCIQTHTNVDPPPFWVQDVVCVITRCA